MFLLLGFLILAVCLWMLPVLTMGYPLQFPELSAAKDFIDSGVLPSGDGRLSIIIIAALHQFISWNSYLSWTLLSCILFAASLFPWWFAVRKLFDTEIAWISTAVLACVPLYFFEAMHLNFYSFAFVFLFCAFASFVCVPKRNILTRIILFGLFLGLAAGAKEAFLILLPWILFSHCRALKLAVVFCIAVAVGYCAPLAPQLLLQEESITQVVAQLSPIGRTELSPMEHYPDPYTYEFDREWHDAKIIKEREESSKFLNLRNQHRLLTFGVIEGDVWRYLVSSTWLLVHNLIAYIHQETFGGAFLWLFIIVGGVQLYQRDKKLLLWFIGLVVSMELIIRYGLQFQRGHSMNIAWGFTVLAALGVSNIAALFSRKRLMITLGITLVICVQLLQVNRSLLAREYMRSTGPRVLMEAQKLQELPEDAVIAVPRPDISGILGGKELVMFHPETLQRIVDQKKVREAMQYYGITHISRYSQDLSDAMQVQHRISVVTVVEDNPPTPKTSDGMGYILNLLH